MRSIEQRIEGLKERVAAAAKRSGREPQDITIVVASKYAQAAQLRPVAEAGLKVFGENKVQDLLAKQDSLAGLAGPIEWHFIGHLQSNKVRQVVPAVSLIHSIDSLGLAAEVDKRAERLQKVQDILVEVNIAADPAKWGFPPEALQENYQRLTELKNINIRGLMCMAPYLPAEECRPYFRSMAELAKRLETEGLFDGATVLSMGMTNDFEVAVEEGSTMIRLGSAIFQEGTR